MPELNELPQGWKWVRLGDVAKQDRLIVEPYSKLSNLPYLGLEHIESNSGKILKDIQEKIEDEGKSTTFYFNENHILYGKLRPYLNKVALPNFEGRCTTELMPFLPKDNINREFIAWILKRDETISFVMQEATGSRMPRADIDKLLNLIIPLPPLPEQQRLATLLTAKLALIEQAKEKITAQLQAAQELTAAYLREVFESEEAKGWELVKLGDVCKSIVPNRDKPKSFSGSYRWITLPDFNENTIYLDIKENYLGLSKEEILEYNARIVPKGSVIMSCVGRFGLSAIVEQDIIPNQQIHAFIVPKEIDYKYLAYFLKFNKNYFESIATSTIINYLNKSNCESVLFPLLPLIEQQKIANYLSEKLATVEQLKATLQTQLDSINQLPAALLKQAFSGNL